MLPSLCLSCCILVAAQPADGPDVVLLPRLGRAQELVYRGTFTEEASGGGVQFDRTYRLETRVFVLDTPPDGADVAFLTLLRMPSARPAAGAQVRPGGESSVLYSVRLERARVDLQGRVTAESAVSLAVPIEGPPSIDCGAFVEVQRNRIGPGTTWDVNDDGRPPRTWRVAGTEMVNGTSCLKLVGRQQSDDWEQPRPDRAAWRRQDTVWLSPRQGIAARVERVIERREPAGRETTRRSVLRCELESSLQYPAQLSTDRRREILQARSFAESAAPLLPAPAKYKSQLEALLSKINHHLDHQPPTPYREAVLQVKRRVEAGRRGETPPAPREEPAPTIAVAAVGRRAPDFVAPDFTGKESARLRRWEGRPLLMVFYNPTSPTADELLRFARRIHEIHAKQAGVVALAMSSDADRVRKQHAELQLPFAVLDGSGLRISYAVEATPQMVVLDADGVVRGVYVGWGSETSAEVVGELRRCVAEQGRK